MLTEAFRIFFLKRALRNWGVVLQNPACQVPNRKLALRNWVNAAKRRKKVPLWRLIRVKGGCLQLKNRSFQFGTSVLKFGMGPGAEK